MYIISKPVENFLNIHNKELINSIEAGKVTYCEYALKLFLTVLVVFILYSWYTLMGLVFLMWYAGMVLWVYALVDTVPVGWAYMPEWITVGCVLTSALLVFVAGGLGGIWCIVKVYEKVKPKVKKPGMGFFKTGYRAWKDKFCPLVGVRK